MFCKNCGNELREDSVFCDKCGAGKVETKIKKQTNLLAVIGLVVAGISLLLNFWGLVGIAAVVLSSIGLVQINKNEEKGKGMAITGIAIGAFSIVYGVIMILSIL